MNLENFWDAKKLSENHSKIKKVFFYRVCGMGMGTCAKLLKEAGFEVEGADSTFFPPMSDYLKQADIPSYSLDKVNEDFLKNYDLIVVGNSVGGQTETARMIEEVGIPFTSFPTLMGELILKDRSVIGIAGTHGKTTTTYYFTQVLDRLGAEPGYFVAGILNDRPPAALGKGKYFVIESDEYDTSYFQKNAKLRHYNIKHLVLTSLEFDHADIYADTDAIEREFHVILPQLERMIGNSDYPCVMNVAKEYSGPTSFYGHQSEFGPRNLNYQNGKCQFTLKYKGQELTFETSVIGDHNILNLSSVILFCLEEGYEYEKVKSAVEKIENVKRRQELRGKFNKAIVVEDFAHHPSSVEVTLDAIKKKYPGLPVHCIIEPSTSTARSEAFQEKFIPVFKGAASVTIADPKLPTNAVQFQNLNFEKLSNDIEKKLGIKSITVSELNELQEVIKELSTEESVLLIMGNRTILGLWESEFVNQLK